jgi:tripartite-type tricarboxylate transporter receptor subunit TctC
MFATRFLRRCLAPLALLAAVCSAAAAYPEKPIWMVVPYSVGGSGDVTGRLLAKRLSERLGHQVLVDNKPGAGASIGEEHVARAAPDGYTVLYDATSLSVNPALRPLKFDAEKDLVPVAQVANMYVTLVAPANAPYNTLAEFLEYARKNPDKASYASAGPGTAGHLATELLKTQTKASILHVPYKGGGPAVLAAISGEVSVYFATPGSGMPHIRSGKLKPLAVAAPRRQPALPNTPTFAELGFPDVVASEWTGLFVPKGTPADVIQFLNKEVREIIAEPAMAEQFSKMGVDTVTGTPREFQQFVSNETRRWGAIVRQLNLKAD